MLHNHVCAFFSGGVFGTEVHYTWEFDSTRPIRSTVLIFMLYFPVFFIAQVSEPFDFQFMKNNTFVDR